MAGQTASQEIRAFSKGIITEASPLTFPDNASIDENNLVIENDGSRRRRFGMNFEPNYAVTTTTQQVTADLAFSSFMWKSPGGYTELEFVAVQTGNQLFIFDSSTRPVSNSLIFSDTFTSDPATTFSMTSVDGLMIVASKSAAIKTYDWNGSTITSSTGRLKIRDLFGVEDVVNGMDLLDGTNIAFRPTTLTQAHTYNLRNQTYATPRYYMEIETLNDPIFSFRDRYPTDVPGENKFPANSDSVVPYLYADANDADDRNTRRYFSGDGIVNPLGTNRAPVGYFIIDALNRGASRISECAKLKQQYPQNQYDVTTLPADTTPDGASVAASFAGRVWFAGFSSKIIGGDKESPRMGSYVLFSRLVKNTSDVYRCYQEGDPTSSETPDLVDTDGGFIRLDGANNIQKLVNVGDALIVIAENGVWRITGGSGYGFKATDYLTNKVTEHGSISPSAVVIIDNTVMYWSEDGIYHIAPNQYGDWTASNLSTNTIQKLFDNIPFTEKVRAQGLFDSYQRKVRWLYNTELAEDVPSKELILDVNLGSFYTSSVQQLSGEIFPKPVSIIKVPPFTVGEEEVVVVNNIFDTVVNSAGDSVAIKDRIQNNSVSELMYLTAYQPTSGTFKFTFSYYYDSSFKDWTSYNGEGVDAPAFLVTGWTGFGDFQRQKQIPYLTIYALKTETGFDNDLVPINSSSIITQSQWSWTNSSESGKWGVPFQAYRHSRLWAPTSSSDGFDNGEYVVTTRNKLRGRGNVLSLKFSTEPGKDFKLLGWSYIVNVNGAP